ncbi:MULTISPECIES: TadE/TadG family type IV pilus assembly protein [unclassified Brenneria]|uniref:TadE/TadG family type IV pilus assembly protein n=1 Tax=unclassified Brenneria TaxID=2634434 RepID=UPI001555F0CE|nr:TadE family protein [Brenneria sp. hezel4-2-4]MEE3651084.1 TadE family protein [Brenneria sp. HEZEL_4_2_4]NPD01039.1 pilus assembly protein [Brenneria sp. hezel4-2-4]
MRQRAMNICGYLRQRVAQAALWRVGRNCRGVVAIEAALIIPLAVFLIIGAWELYHYFRTAAVVDRAAFMVANSLSMQRELKDGNGCRLADDICTYQTIAPDLMTPLDYQRNGGLVISFYTAEEANGEAVWQTIPERPSKIFKGSGNSRVPVSRLAPPAGFPQAEVGDAAIVVEVFYHYTPFAIGSTFWRALGAERQIVSRVFYRPRFIPLRIESE